MRRHTHSQMKTSTVCYLLVLALLFLIFQLLLNPMNYGGQFNCELQYMDFFSKKVWQFKKLIVFLWRNCVSIIKYNYEKNDNVSDGRHSRLRHKYVNIMQ